MSPNLHHQLDLLPNYLGNHVLISVIALAIGLAISVPLAVACVRVGFLRWPLMTSASVIQTIPSLALLALMVPILVAIQSAGVDISTLGFYPAIIALTLYSILPILRNTVTGIEGVDPSLTEAARGMGMTSSQILFRVETPLALPVIIAGIRTATVWVVGIATLSTPVGQTSLGNYIFTGLQTTNWTAVIVGCVAAAVLAIVLDLLIAALQLAAARRSKRLAVFAGVGLLVVVCGGLYPVVSQRLSRAPRFKAITPIIVTQPATQPNAATTAPGSFTQPATASTALSGRGTALIGAKTFTEQYILSRLLAIRLHRMGFGTRVKSSLGSTVVFNALATGEIDVYVDYSGTIWANRMKRKDVKPSAVVLREMTDWLKKKYGIVNLGALGFENAYALAMRGEQARKLHIKTIADLTRYAPSLKIGGDYEFFGRPEWKRVTELYHLRFAAPPVSMDSNFMYGAVAHGEVDVISAFSSDGRIAAYDLETLEDPKHALPPYDAVVLLSARAAKNRALVAALKPLIGKIGIELMRRANQLVDMKDRAPQAAADWLDQQVGEGEPPMNADEHG